MPWPSEKQKNKPRKPKVKPVDAVITAVTEGGGALVTPEIEDKLDDVVLKELKNEDNIAFKANPGPQTEFLAAGEQEVLFAGGKGSSKTYGLMVDPLRWCGNKAFRGVIIRRTIPDVRDIIFKAKQLYPKAYPGVEWKETEKCFYFPSGARLEFGFAETLSDLPKYQGQNYTYVGIDEIADFPFAEELLTYMRANLRTVDPINVPVKLRLTANPAAVSSNYLRKEFIEKAPSGETFWDSSTFFDPRTKKPMTVHISKKHIHSTVFDNPYLLQDPTYVATLANLPEAKRKAWLLGDWWASENSAFPEFEDSVHVVAPFEVPRGVQRIRGGDWGYRSEGVVVWGAVMPNGQIVVYREFVFKGKDALKVAQEGKAMELGENIRVGVMDTSAWAKRGELGESIGEVLTRVWGRWIPSSRNRTDGKGSRVNRVNLLHRYLAIDPMTGEPRLVITANCRRTIECIKAIPVDPHNVEDVDTDSPYDHAYDGLTYMLQSRPTQHKTWLGDFGSNVPVVKNTMADPTFGY